jgi:hypothetical protein
LKQLQEVAGNILEHVSIDNDFLNKIPVAQQLREKMNKWEGIKLKRFCSTITRLKRPSTE